MPNSEIERMLEEVRNVIPVPDPSDCPLKDEHTPGPADYMAWHRWADEMSKTHRQVQCPACGFWVVWLPKGELS